MTNFERAKLIRNCIVNRFAEVISYGWDDIFCLKYIRESEHRIKSCDWYEDIVLEFTKPELEELGFGLWSKESQLYLIPLWLFPFLPDKVKLTSVNGDYVLEKSSMDRDTRFGCLAYGVLAI